MLYSFIFIILLCSLHRRCYWQTQPTYLKLLSNEICQPMAAFEWNLFSGMMLDINLSLFSQKGRKVFLSTTCFLSSFQNLKLCHNASQWMKLRLMFPKCHCFCFPSCTLHLPYINVLLWKQMAPKETSKKTTEKIYSAVHWIFQKYYLTAHMHVVLHWRYVLWPHLPSGAPSLPHKQQIQHIHSHGLSPRPFCETKAPSSILDGTKANLILMNTLVSFYFLPFYLFE